MGDFGSGSSCHKTAPVDHFTVFFIIYGEPYLIRIGGIRNGKTFICIYNGTSVPWIIRVNNFRFLNNISETMLPTNMYNISLERSLLLVFVV